MPEAFFEPDGERFRATEWTRGPWSPDHQHGGPATALIGRALERKVGEGWRVGRLTHEFLGPVPIGPVSVTTRVARPGRGIQLLEAELSGERGAPLILTRCWAVRIRRVEFDREGAGVDITPPGPEEGEPGEFFPTGFDVGYHGAVEVRFVRGGFTEPGPAMAWIRMRGELVAGEKPSQLTRVLIAADSGNGVSGPLDFRRYEFINMDLTVSLARPPRGEWVGLDAATDPQPEGIGLSDAALVDEEGRIGRALQTLVVRERET